MQGVPSDEELHSAVPPRAGGKEVRIGLFVIAGVLSALVALFLLTDPAAFRGRYLVTTTVAEAGGLRRGDPVQMLGVNIGRVHAFELSDEQEAVDVVLEIEGRWKVPVDSRVRLVSLGLLGGRIADITPGPSSEYVRDGDVLPGEIVSGLADAAGDLGGEAEVVIDRVKSLLSDPTVEAVRSSAVELEKLLQSLNTLTEAQGQEMERLVASLNRSAEGLEEATGAGPDVARAIARADSTMLQLRRTSDTLSQTMGSLRTILERVERGEGTLGKLATDDSLYANLNRALESVARLTTDLRENPGRYVKLAIF